MQCTMHFMHRLQNTPSTGNALCTCIQGEDVLFVVYFPQCIVYPLEQQHNPSATHIIVARGQGRMPQIGLMPAHFTTMGRRCLGLACRAEPVLDVTHCGEGGMPKLCIRHGSGLGDRVTGTRFPAAACCHIIRDHQYGDLDR